MLLAWGNVFGGHAMTRPRSAKMVFLLFVCSCASTPAAQKTERPPSSAPAVAAPSVVTPASPPVPATEAETRPKLGAGQCVESFDCVDTVGFPPPGHRWTCDNGKCGRAKLPDLGGEAPTAGAADTDKAAVADEKAPSRSSTRRRKR